MRAKSLFQTFIFGSLLFLSACYRPAGEGSSKVAIPIPQFSFGQTGSFDSIPAGKKACFGVNVEGPGITNTSAPSCNKSVGITGGFVEEGQVLSVEVYKGDSRKFEVLMLLVDSTASCPSFESNFFSSSANAASAYVAGVTENVRLANDVESVAVKVSFPGQTNTLASQLSSTCNTNARLKAQLLSNGEVLDSGGAPLGSHSDPLNQGMYLTDVADPLGIGLITSGGVLNFYTANAVELPAQVHSVTRKPDSGKFYGLLHSGKIVEISITGASGTFTELTSSDCPFQVVNCEVPVWMQSISAGFGNNLYSLDHGGNVYQLTSSDPVPTGVIVPEYVTQVSFY